MLKKFFVIIIIICAFQSLHAQNRFFVSLQVGSSFQGTNYSNELNYTDKYYSISGAYGVNAGYQFDRLSVETGFYRIYVYHRMVSWDVFNYELKDEIVQTPGFINNVIPLRFCYSIPLGSSKFSVEPFIGALYSFGVDEKLNWTRGGHMEYGLYDFPEFIDWTDQGLGERISNDTFSLQSGLRVVCELNSRLDIYVHGDFTHQLNPTYCVDIEHVIDGETIYGASTDGSDIDLHCGVRLKL